MQMTKHHARRARIAKLAAELNQGKHQRATTDQLAQAFDLGTSTVRRLRKLFAL